MTATTPNRDGIALRAYFIWNDEGRPHGRHEDHWFAAEALEVRAAEPAAAVAAPARKAAPAAKKAAAPKKVAQPKAVAPQAETVKAAALKAPAETVVAAAALAAPRAARGAAKGARPAH